MDDQSSRSVPLTREKSPNRMHDTPSITMVPSKLWFTRSRQKATTQALGVVVHLYSPRKKIDYCF
ncbi:MAG: hypothetical protein ACTSUE_06770 [Promethearchaeota archaeon]